MARRGYSWRWKVEAGNLDSESAGVPMNKQKMLDELVKLRNGLNNKSIPANEKSRAVVSALGVMLETLKIEEAYQRMADKHGGHAKEKEMDSDDAPLLRQAEEIYREVKEVVGGDDSEGEF